MDAKFTLIGNSKTMEVYEDHCVIMGRKGVAGVMTGNVFNGSKEFYYVDLTSVQYKKASVWSNGFIQFEYPGSHSGGGNRTSENSFVIVKALTTSGINHDYLKRCEEAYLYIKERIAFYKKQKNTPLVVAEVSSADELKKFKELLDQGIITQEEFDAKKKQLLDL